MRLLVTLLLVSSLSACDKDADPATTTATTKTPTRTETKAPTEAPAPRPEATTTADYAALSKARYAEIKAAMEKMDDWNPIRIEGYDKAELVKFYIDSYEDDTVKGWPAHAYEKMKSFPESKPTPEQNEALSKLAAKPGTRASMFEMMMLLTPEQIETIGY